MLCCHINSHKVYAFYECFMNAPFETRLLCNGAFIKYTLVRCVQTISNSPAKKHPILMRFSLRTRYWVRLYQNHGCTEIWAKKMLQIQKGNYHWRIFGYFGDKTLLYRACTWPWVIPLDGGSEEKKYRNDPVWELANIWAHVYMILGVFFEFCSFYPISEIFLWWVPLWLFYNAMTL